MPITITSRRFTARSRPPTIPAPTILGPFDTEDGGLFIPTKGFLEDHDATLTWQYEVQGGIVRDMLSHETWETGPAGQEWQRRITICGHRTARAHDMTGTGNVRFRTVADGYASAWTDWIAYTVTSPTPTTASSVGVGADAFAITANFDASYDVIECEHQKGYWTVVAPSGLTVNSVSPVTKRWVEFNSGGTTAIAVGNTVTTAGGFSGVVSRVVVDGGAWASGNATGWLVFETGTTGSITTGNALLVGGVDRATAFSGLQYVHGHGINPQATANVFCDRSVAPRADPAGDNQASFPMTMQPGETLVLSSADETDLRGNSPVRRMLGIAVVGARPAAGLLPPSPYRRTNLTTYDRVMLHEQLWTADRVPRSTTFPAESEANFNSRMDNWVAAFAPAFRSGTNATRYLFPSLHIRPYHQDTLREHDNVLVNALADSRSDADRERAIRAVAMRTLVEIAHVAATRHEYWWHQRPLITGAVAGIWEMAAARKCWFYRAADREGSDDGNVYLPAQAPSVDIDPINGSTNYRKASDLIERKHGSQWPRQGDPALYDGCWIERTVTFTPSVAEQAPRLRNVTDNGDGTWTIAAGSAFYGEAAAMEKVRWMDHRAASPNGQAFANLVGAFNGSAGNYTLGWTDSENNASKISSYTWQHRGRLAMLWLYLNAFGLTNFAHAYEIEAAAEDFMGVTHEWMQALDNQAHYTVANPETVRGSYPASNAESIMNLPGPYTFEGSNIGSYVRWFTALDAAKAVNGFLASYRTRAAPAKLDRTRVQVEALGGGTARARLLGWPSDVGNDPITDWQIEANGGTPVAAGNGYVREVWTSFGVQSGLNVLRFRTQNGQGWSRWSAPKVLIAT